MVEHRQHVVVDDIRMSFGGMVVFMVKAAIASIPAVIILSMVFSARGDVCHGRRGWWVASYAVNAEPGRLP